MNTEAPFSVPVLVNRFATGQQAGQIWLISAQHADGRHVTGTLRGMRLDDGTLQLDITDRQLRFKPSEPYCATPPDTIRLRAEHFHALATPTGYVLAYNDAEGQVEREHGVTVELTVADQARVPVMARAAAAHDGRSFANPPVPVIACQPAPA